MPPLTRAILSLGLTQIIGYGTLYYAFGVVAKAIGRDIGVSLPFAYGAFSLALLAGGLVAPVVGRQIDRHGAGRVMALGSGAAALALLALSQVQGAATLVLALIAVEVVATLVLYDAAFAALAQIAPGGGARRAITLMTLLGGFASTLFWPVTLWLEGALGWRGAYLGFAALHLLICLPLHLTLPRAVQTDIETAHAPAFAPLPLDRQPMAMLWLAIGFSLAGVVLSALAAQWVPVLEAMDLSAEQAVLAGAVLGPAQVAVRVLDLWLGVRRHPLDMGLLAGGMLALALVVVLVLPGGLISAMLFAGLYGLSSGLTSIVRGTIPLALFGAQGFAGRLGILASARLISGALAPFGLALALAAWPASWALGLCLGLALLALGAMALVPRR
jgi:hypothetical protein